MNHEVPKLRTEKGKTIEDVGKQVNRVAGNLIQRAGRAGAGQYGNQIKWDYGNISVDTGEVDSTGRKVKQEIKSLDGRYQSDGSSKVLVKGAGTIDGVTMITAHENGAMTAGRFTQNEATNISGVQQPLHGDGRPNDGNPRGYSPDALVHDAAGQLAEIRGQVAQAEMLRKQ